jgi:hypothetical protein
MTNPLSREELREKAFGLLQQINTIEQNYKRSVQELPKPSPPKRAFFGEKKRIYKQNLAEYREAMVQYQAQLDELRSRHDNSSLQHKLAELQEACPHEYGPSERVSDVWEIRKCNICYDVEKSIHLVD